MLSAIQCITIRFNYFTAIISSKHLITIIKLIVMPCQRPFRQNIYVLNSTKQFFTRHSVATLCKPMIFTLCLPRALIVHFYYSY